MVRDTARECCRSRRRSFLLKKIFLIFNFFNDAFRRKFITREPALPKINVGEVIENLPTQNIKFSNAEIADFDKCVGNQIAKLPTQKSNRLVYGGLMHPMHIPITGPVYYARDKVTTGR